MIRSPAHSLTGIHAATIVPMHDDYSLDEAALAQHIADVTAVKGIRGLLINGHAGENFTLTVAEKKRVVEIARAVAPADCYLVSGVNQESSRAFVRSRKGVGRLQPTRPTAAISNKFDLNLL